MQVQIKSRCFRSEYKLKCHDPPSTSRDLRAKAGAMAAETTTDIRKTATLLADVLILSIDPATGGARQIRSDNDAGRTVLLPVSSNKQ